MAETVKGDAGGGIIRVFVRPVGARGVHRRMGSRRALGPSSRALGSRARAPDVYCRMRQPRRHVVSLIVPLLSLLIACHGGPATRESSASSPAPSTGRSTASAAAPSNPTVAHPVASRLRDSLHAILQRAHRDSIFPGAIAVVGRGDGVVATVSVGRLDWAANASAPDARTLWDIASLTKVVGMTTAVAQLVQQGKIALDAPVQRYLPEWRGANKERVLVRHLLVHRSGLPAFRRYFAENIPADSIRQRILAEPLDVLPDTRTEYSDLGAYLLGRIVERVSGESLDAYLARHVFGPLGMSDTRYRPGPELRARVAPTEHDAWRGRHVHGEVHDENAFALGGVSAHAGLFSSAHDLARFARMYLNQGALDGRRVLEPATIARFTARADAASTRALGWDTAPGGAGAGRQMSARAFGHTGFTGTSLWVDPAADVFVILLTNRVNPSRARGGIAPIRTAVADAAVGLLSPRP